MTSDDWRVTDRRAQAERQADSYETALISRVCKFHEIEPDSDERAAPHMRGLRWFEHHCSAYPVMWGVATLGPSKKSYVGELLLHPDRAALLREFRKLRGVSAPEMEGRSTFAMVFDLPVLHRFTVLHDGLHLDMPDGLASQIVVFESTPARTSRVAILEPLDQLLERVALRWSPSR